MNQNIARRSAALAATLCASLAAQAQGQSPAAQAPAVTVGGSFTLVSDYQFRGISVSNRKPAVQGGIDFTHRSGAYLSLWASSVSEVAYSNTSGQEFDILLGWRRAIATDTTLEAALALYYFPGAEYTSVTGDGATLRYDTRELKLGLSKDIYNLTLWYGLNRYWSGIDFDNQLAKTSTRGTSYVEFNVNPPLTDALTLNLHIGRQIVRHASFAHFTDYRIGLTLDGAAFALPGWSASISAVHNTGSQNAWGFYYRDGRPAKDSTGSSVLLTVSRSF